MYIILLDRSGVLIQKLQLKANRALIFNWQLINAQNKMREMYDLMDSVNEWIDDGQGLIKEYRDDMPSEEQVNLKKRAEVHTKC